jgi:cysteinyl-tRNA synthetase
MSGASAESGNTTASAETDSTVAVADDGQDFEARLTAYRERFDSALGDDLNTADALGILFDAIRDVNFQVDKRPEPDFARKCRDALSAMSDVLGLAWKSSEEKSDSDADVEALVALRQEARKNKNFKEADRIRDQLKSMGILLEDTPQGVKIARKA